MDDDAIFSRYFGQNYSLENKVPAKFQILSHTAKMPLSSLASKKRMGSKKWSIDLDAKYDFFYCIFKKKASYGNFLFVKVMQNLNFVKFWNPEKYQDRNPYWANVTETIVLKGVFFIKITWDFLRPVRYYQKKITKKATQKSKFHVKNWL